MINKISVTLTIICGLLFLLALAPFVLIMRLLASIADTAYEWFLETNEMANEIVDYAYTEGGK